jgi:hypothetical protein
MADVVFVFVREDESEAETLAEVFDAAGFSVGDNIDDGALSILVWSRRALRCNAFHDAAASALSEGRAVIASLAAPPARERVFGAPVVDLSGWDGQEEAPLNSLLEIADSMARARPANIIRLPAQPSYEDAEFSEPTSRRAWEAPIPTQMLREPKPGAHAPRRDFSRLGQRRSHTLAHAALAAALLALIGGAVVTARMLVPQPDAVAAAPDRNPPAGVSLAEASAYAFLDPEPTPAPLEAMPGEPPSAPAVVSRAPPPASILPGPARAAPLIVAEDTRVVGPQS